MSVNVDYIWSRYKLMVELLSHVSNSFVYVGEYQHNSDHNLLKKVLSRLSQEQPHHNIHLLIISQCESMLIESRKSIFPVKADCSFVIFPHAKPQV